MTDLSAIKAKIVKLLRMQQSSNANEAANAAAFVEKLCKEHGIIPETLDETEADKVVESFITLRGKRINKAQQLLMQGVVHYFNGRIVITRIEGDKAWDIFATKGNRLQIEIYFEYLLEQMDDFAEGAKLIALVHNEEVGTTFKRDFCLGFAETVMTRLYELKKEQEENGTQASEWQNYTPGLVITNRNNDERRNVSLAVQSKYPRLSRGTRQSYNVRGNGGAAGRRAGNSVSLNRQVGGNSQRRLCAG